MKKIKCCECGTALKRDEIALSQKLIDVETKNFYCISCMAEYFGCEEEDLVIKINEFREQGCTLFL